MTPHRKARNYAVSVLQRFLNLARHDRVNYNLMLQRYAAERFLYRLSVSSEAERFIVKGATLFRVRADEDLRPTRDVDFLAVGLEDDSAIRTSLEATCDTPCPEDGVVFDPAAIRIDTIRDEQPNASLQVRIRGSLGQARLPLRVDISFGNVITPKREVPDCPTLLDLPAPRLWTYPRETLAAEKLEAMVRLAATSSRVKDLWDFTCLARHIAFDGETLRTAITETFRRRRTALAGERLPALVPGYYEDAARGKRWRELRLQVEAGTDSPARLVDASEELRRFLGPVCDSLIEERPFTQAWLAGLADWGFRFRRRAKNRD